MTKMERIESALPIGTIKSARKIADELDLDPMDVQKVLRRMRIANRVSRMPVGFLPDGRPAYEFFIPAKDSHANPA